MSLTDRVEISAGVFQMEFGSGLKHFFKYLLCTILIRAQLARQCT